MQTTSFNPTKNITCFDLEITNWENLYYHAVSAGLCGFQIELLKEQFDEAHLKIKNVDKLYIDTIYTVENCIFLGTNKNGLENLAPYIEFNLEFLNKLKCPTALEKNISVSINDKKNLHLDDTTFGYLENESKKINPNIPLKHLNDFIILEIPKTSITANELIHHFSLKLDFCDDQENIDLNDLQLHTVYYKNRTAVAFDFIVVNTTAVYKAWSSEFIAAILKRSPINNSKLNKTETLNSILEKINTEGINVLSSAQKQFLSAL